MSKTAAATCLEKGWGPGTLYIFNDYMPAYYYCVYIVREITSPPGATAVLDRYRATIDYRATRDGVECHVGVGEEEARLGFPIDAEIIATNDGEFDIAAWAQDAFCAACGHLLSRHDETGCKEVSHGPSGYAPCNCAEGATSHWTWRLRRSSLSSLLWKAAAGI